MRNIRNGSSSSRNKREDRYHSTKNYKSARDTANMYWNYLGSESLNKLSMFNNLLGKHAPKRSIDTNNIIDVDQKVFQKTRSDNIRNSSRKGSSRTSKVYGYDSNNPYPPSMNNEYTNSAHTSQFTFGAGPESRHSDFGMSGTTSANKSVSKENILYTMNDVIKMKKIKHRQNKSNDKHRRSESKNSKKGKKHSKKKSSNKQIAPPLNGYYIAPKKPKIESKSRNHMYQSSSTSQYGHSHKSSDMFKSGFTPNHHSSYFGNGKIPSVSPFLTKMTTKSKNSRNEGLFKLHSGTEGQKKSEMALNILGAQKVNILLNFLKKTSIGKSRNDVFNQIKTSAHAKTSSDNFFNIPWYAYGTNDKNKNESESSSWSKSKNKSKRDSGRNNSKDKIQNPLQALIAKKLYNEMNNGHQNSIVPANNSSGTSTQGSSTRDAKSSSKKRKMQQEWYYKSSATPSNLIYWQGEQAQILKNGRANGNFQFEAASPNIFIVEQKESNNQLKIANQRIGLHEYSLGDTNEKHTVRYFFRLINLTFEI